MHQEVGSTVYGHMIRHIYKMLDETDNSTRQFAAAYDLPEGYSISTPPLQMYTRPIQHI